MHTYSDGTSACGVEVGDQGKRCGNVKGLADAHGGTRPDELIHGGDIAGEIGHKGPCEQAEPDDTTPAETIRNEAADGAEKGVGPLEGGEHVPPGFLVRDAGDVLHHGFLHRGQHLPIQIIQ
jgi:hypothetical protein